MPGFIENKRRKLILTALGFSFTTALVAQTTGALYDPQPPADSGYVRVIVVNTDALVDIQLDGKNRTQGLAASMPSDYMAVKAGAHRLTLLTGGKLPPVDIPLEVVAGRSTTVALHNLRADTKPVFFDDKGNSNRLKAVMTLYHLANKVGPVDTLTADGATKVFSGVAPGTSASLSVNPIAVELQANKVGEKTALARATLALAQGQTYSLLLVPGDGDKLLLKSSINAVERYTGK